MIRHRQVEAFAAIVRTGSTVSAARSLNTSQPTISRLIAQLRDQVGFELFINQGGKLKLTEEGALFFRDVEQFLMTTTELERRAWQIRNYGISEVRLATIPSVNLQIVPDALAVLRQQIENLSFGVVQLEHDQATLVVESGKVDFGVCNNIYPGDDLEAFRSVMFRCVLAVPGDHRLAAQDVVKAPDLIGESFISLGDAFFAEYLADEMARQILHDNTKNFASSSAPLISLVEAGNGIGIVDPISAAYDTRDHVIFVPFEPQVNFPVSIVHKRDVKLSSAAEALCDILFNALEKEAANRPW